MSELHRTAGEYRADGCFISEEIPDEAIVSSYDTSRQVPGAVIPVRLPGDETPKIEEETPVQQPDPTPAPAVEPKAIPASPENKSLATANTTKKAKKKGEK